MTMTVSRRVFPQVARRCCVPALMAVAGVVYGADAPTVADGKSADSKSPVDREIVVNATKQAEELHRLPATVAAFDDRELASRGALNLGELWQLTPNVTQFTDKPNGQITVRGVGTGEQPRTGGEENPTRGQHAAVGLYMDGLPVESTRGLAAFDDLLDVEQVELLKGPQGTLYGRNALGGVVNVRSRDPGLHAGVDGHVFYGSDNELRVSAAGGGPVTSALGARVAVGYASSDGSLSNATTGTDDTASWERIQGRAKAVWRAKDDLDLRLTVSGVRYEGSTDYWVPYDNRESRKTVTNNPGEETITGGTAAVQSDWHASADDTLTLIVGAGLANDDVTYDGDRSAANAANIEGFNHTLTSSFEARWSHRSKDPVSWLVGVFAEQEQITYDADTTFSDQDLFGPGTPYHGIIGYPRLIQKESEATAQSAALFGEGTWKVDSHWELTAGVRLGFERSEFDWQQQNIDVQVAPGPTYMSFTFEEDGERDEMVVLPKGVLAYRFDDERMLYASVVRGYRAGGFNVNASSQTSAQIEYDPEYTWNYELGLRSRWLDRCLSFNLTGFYIDWRDQQVFTSVAPFDVAQVNAGRSHVIGGETELAWRDPSGFSAWASGGLQQAEFDERVDQFSGYDYAGKVFAHVPKWTWALGAGYRHTSGVFGRLDWHGQSWTYVNDTNDKRADAVALLDARIGFAGAKWMVALVGRNLTDETYIINSFDLPGDTLLTVDSTYVRLGPARSIGVEASAWW